MTVDTKVLVAYASAHGSTKGVAEAIAHQLSSESVPVELRAADDVTDARVYDAVVLGSAIHNGSWLTPASKLLTEIGREPGRPLWLFSVCTIGETTSFLPPRVSRLARRARKLPPGVADARAPHRYFAGVIERSHWNAVGRLFFLVTGGRYGDHRDWADIELWTKQIVATLASDRTVPERSDARPRPPFESAGWRFGNALVAVLARVGIGPIQLLTTRGRTTGRPRTNPVVPVDVAGKTWLVAPYGPVSWVHNARARGQVTLRYGRATGDYAVREVGAAEAGPVLKHYVEVATKTRTRFDATKDSPVEDFIAEADRHPVFELTPLDEPSR